MTTQSCPTCPKLMKPIPVQSNVRSSEWYCEPCHKSLRMNEETAREFIALKQRALQGR